jgi:hypothetical protein
MVTSDQAAGLALAALLVAKVALPDGRSVFRYAIP